MISNSSVNILLIEDEDYDVRRVQNTIAPFQKKIKIINIVSNGQAAIEYLEKSTAKVDVVIMDFQISGGLTGERLIRRIKEIDPTLQIIVVTKMTINITDFEFANSLLEAGAMWYCTKYPGDIEEYIYQPTDFVLSIFNAAEKKHLEKERLKSQRKLTQNVEQILAEKQIIGDSEETRQLMNLIQKAAKSETTVLIQGSSGTGKELIAANIHYQSARKFEKFVPINCGSLPQTLIESELFGFEKGAFTGAHTDKPGLLEIAHKGTAFLDEISELPASAQSKLLRFIQEGEIDKIGRTESLKVDVRIIAATNKNLSREVEQGRFREDLFYRLNVFNIWLPDLTRRKRDIPGLVHFYLKKFSSEMGKETPVISKEAIKSLENYNWPGNVRELQNIIQRVILFGKNEIGADDVEAALGKSTATSKNQIQRLWDAEHIMTLRELENDLREKYFRFVRENSASDAEAARKLGLAPPNYHRMCKELGIK